MYLCVYNIHIYIYMYMCVLVHNMYIEKCIYTHKCIYSFLGGHADGRVREGTRLSAHI